MAWRIEFRPNARSDLRRLDQPVRRRLIGFLETRVLATGNPRRFGKPLRGGMGEFWAYRIGDYRIICRLEDERLVVVVVSIGHRKDVYRSRQA